MARRFRAPGLRASRPLDLERPGRTPHPRIACGCRRDESFGLQRALSRSFRPIGCRATPRNAVTARSEAPSNQRSARQGDRLACRLLESQPFLTRLQARLWFRSGAVSSGRVEAGGWPGPTPCRRFKSKARSRDGLGGLRRLPGATRKRGVHFGGGDVVRVVAECLHGDADEDLQHVRLFVARI